MVLVGGFGEPFTRLLHVLVASHAVEEHDAEQELGVHVPHRCRPAVEFVGLALIVFKFKGIVLGIEIGSREQGDRVGLSRLGGGA